MVENTLSTLGLEFHKTAQAFNKKEGLLCEDLRYPQTTANLVTRNLLLYH